MQAPQLPGELPLARAGKAEDPEDICHMPPILIQGKKKKGSREVLKAKGFLRCFCVFENLL